MHAEKAAWVDEKAAMAQANARLAHEKERLENDKAILAKALSQSTERIAELISLCAMRDTSTTRSRAHTKPPGSAIGVVLALDARL